MRAQRLEKSGLKNLGSYSLFGSEIRLRLEKRLTRNMFGTGEAFIIRTLFVFLQKQLAEKKFGSKTIRWEKLCSPGLHECFRHGRQTVVAHIDVST